MKRTLIALTATALLSATATTAFEINITEAEIYKLSGTHTVGDLAVGVIGLLDVYNHCLKDDRMYLLSFDKLETEPSEYSSYYEVEKQPDGDFKLKFKASTVERFRSLPFFSNAECSDYLKYDHDATIYPVKSIDGFTDVRSFIIDLINKGFSP